LESGAGRADGMGLLPTRVEFAAEKVLGRPSGTWRGQRVDAYEIHHGSAFPTEAAESFLDGWRSGAVWGTMWHGAFENDGFRRTWLAEVVPGWSPAPDAPSFTSLRESMLDKLADAVAEHLDTSTLRGLAEAGAPAGLPFVPPGVPS
jgi:adenosylcobyric acid synthase